MIIGLTGNEVFGLMDHRVTEFAEELRRRSLL